MRSQGEIATLRPSSAAKRHAILAAAEDAFLSARYDTVTMDEIANASGVSKQTIYSHFGNKDQLFIALVTTMTQRAGDAVQPTPMEPSATVAELAVHLEDLLTRQLAAVLDPRILRLRRLVIGEVPRFPQLARAVFDHGPQRAITTLSQILADARDRELLNVPDPGNAATQLNWLVMGEPVNRAMFLGDAAVPTPNQQRAHVRAAVTTFLGAAIPH